MSRNSLSLSLSYSLSHTYTHTHTRTHACIHTHTYTFSKAWNRPENSFDRFVCSQTFCPSNVCFPGSFRFTFSFYPALLQQKMMCLINSEVVFRRLSPQRFKAGRLMSRISLSLSLSLSLSHTHTHTHTHILSHTLSLIPLSLSLSRTYTFIQTHTFSLSLSLPPPHLLLPGQRVFTATLVTQAQTFHTLTGFMSSYISVTTSYRSGGEKKKTTPPPEYNTSHISFVHLNCPLAFPNRRARRPHTQREPVS